MFAAFQRLSGKRAPDRDAGPTAPRRRRGRTRSRFRVEPLEPRWLLSTLAGNASDTELERPLSPVASEPLAIYGPISPTAPPAVVVDDWSQAQIIPEAPVVHVLGYPTMGALPDLYEIQVDGTTATIHFLLRSAWDDQPVAESLQLFDSQWNEYARFTPSPDLPSFEYVLPVMAESSPSIFVKVALSPGAGTGTGASDDLAATDSSAFNYVLEVTRQGAETEAETPGYGSQPNPDLPGDTEEFTPLPGEGGGDGGANGELPATRPPTEIIVNPPPQGPVTSLEPAAPATAPGSSAWSGSGSGPGSEALPYGPPPRQSALSVLVPIAVGPLPVRSAAPLGGVFASPDSAPQVDRHEGARADLAMFDPDHYVDDVEFDPRTYVPQGEPGDQTSSPRAIAFRGPGGLPVLATALIAGTATAAAKPGTEGHGELPATAAEVHVETPPSNNRPTLYQGRASASSEEADLSAVTTNSAGVATRASSRGPRRRASVLSGLTFAFGLGVSLVLPDLVAALHFTPSARRRLRLKEGRRPLDR